MKKRKILRTSLIIIVLMISAASLVLYKLGDRIFNEVIDEQLQSLEATIDQASAKVEDIEGSVLQDPKETVSNSDSNQQSQSQPQQMAAGSNQQTTTQPILEQPSQTSALEQPKDVEAPSIQVTKDKLENIKESVTPADKMSAAAMVLKKLSQSDIDTLTKLAAGGITPTEKEKIKSIVYARFTQAEIQQIKAMYYKYMGK